MSKQVDSDSEESSRFFICDGIKSEIMSEHIGLTEIEVAALYPESEITRREDWGGDTTLVEIRVNEGSLVLLLDEDEICTQSLLFP